MMIDRTMFGSGIAALMLLLAAPGAEALQIAVQGPTQDTRVMECLNCTVTLTFTIVNTGIPDNTTASLSTISESVDPNTGDTRYDVLQTGDTTQGMTGQCGRNLAARASCTVQAVFNVGDADPFDTRDPTNDYGRWAAGIGFGWAVSTGPGMTQSGVADAFSFVRVTDQPVPEPRAWALMLLGLGLAGAHMRRRKGVAA